MDNNNFITINSTKSLKNSSKEQTLKNENYVKMNQFHIDIPIANDTFNEP